MSDYIEDAPNPNLDANYGAMFSSGGSSSGGNLGVAPGSDYGSQFTSGGGGIAYGEMVGGATGVSDGFGGSGGPFYNPTPELGGWGSKIMDWAQSIDLQGAGIGQPLMGW